MEIVVDRQVLSDTLSFVRNSIPKKDIEPILNNIYIKSLDNKKTQVVSTDLDLMSVATMPAEVLSEGAMTIPGDKLIKLVPRLTGKDITFKLVDSDIQITCGTYSGVFKTAGTEDYPDARSFDTNKKTATFKKADLLQAFKRIHFAVNEDEARKNLMAVQISHNGAVSTNGKVTALYREDFGVDELYISSNCLNDLLAVIENMKEEEIDVYSDDAYLMFKFGESTFFTRRAVVKFPAIFEKIDEPTKKGNTRTMKFNVKELRASLRRISLTSSDDTKAVKFTVVSDDVCEVSADDGKGFTSKEDIPLLGSSELEDNFKVVFSYEYLEDILSKFVSEEIEFKLNANIRLPVRIEEGNFVCFLMQLVGA